MLNNIGKFSFVRVIHVQKCYHDLLFRKMDDSTPELEDSVVAAEDTSPVNTDDLLIPELLSAGDSSVMQNVTVQEHCQSSVNFDDAQEKVDSGNIDNANMELVPEDVNVRFTTFITISCLEL